MDIRREKPLPFSAWLPFLVGGAYGLLLRLLFSGLGPMPEAMAGAFVYGMPLAVGAVTVYLAERQSRRGWPYYFFAPWLSVTLCVAGAGLTLIEGLICIAMALPLFVMIGSVGGLVTGLLCRQLNRPLRSVQGLTLLPLLLVLGEGLIPGGNGLDRIERSVHIDASPDAVWKLLLNPSDIRPEEVRSGLAYRIGVPVPVQARTLDERIGGIRRSTWARGEYFDEVITDWQPGRQIAWRYAFHPDSFPPGTMDDHVVIGGQYFDLLDTTYRLTPEKDGTRLDIEVGFRTSTKFNWYAIPVAKLMIGDTAETLLGFYKGRLETK